jgi:nitrite reductase/ring-hydroxylating ferredoxin subunit
LSEGATPLPRLNVTPAGVRLGQLELVQDGRGRSFVLELSAGRFHGFVVRRGDAVRGYVDRCPHAGLPLAQTLDEYVSQDGGFIACSWHGALFDPDDGRCVGGPCAGAQLSAWPVDVVDGIMMTGSHDD